MTPYSMLIHTAGTTNDHEKDQKDLQNIIRILSDKTDNKFKQYYNELIEICAQQISHYGHNYSNTEVALFINRNIGKSEVLVINHKHSDNVKRAGSPRALFTFAIGGNIVSADLHSIICLLSFSRNVKGRLQQNTYIKSAYVWEDPILNILSYVFPINYLTTGQIVFRTMS